MAGDGQAVEGSDASWKRSDAASPPDPSGPARRPWHRKPWYRRPWVYVVAGAVAVAVIAGSMFYYFGRPERPFTPLSNVTSVPLRGTPLGADIEGDSAFLTSHDDGELHVVAVELATGEVRRAKPRFEGTWEKVTAQSSGLLAYGRTGRVRTLHVYDRTSLERVYSEVLEPDAWHFSVGETLVRVEPDEARLVWIDLAEKKKINSVRYEGTFFRVGNVLDEAEPASLTGTRFQQTYPDNRLVTVDDEGTLSVLQVQDGRRRQQLAIEPLERDTRALAYQGLFLVARPAEEGPGYQVWAYDLDKLSEPAPLYRDDRAGVRPRRLAPCGESFLCVLNSAGELVVLNFRNRELVWRTDLANADGVAAILPVGDRIMVNHTQGGTVYNVLYNGEGELVSKKRAWGAPVDAGSELLFGTPVASLRNGRTNVTDHVMPLTVRGIGAQSFETTRIGELDANPATCSWDDAYITCAGRSRFLVYRFRDA